jgi:hypothetical protein
LACALGVALLLAACAKPQQAGYSEPATAPPESGVQNVAALPPGEQATALRAITPIIDDDPARVVGMDGLELERALGPPNLRRVDPPAEVWQYAAHDCVMDVFLYEDDRPLAPHRVTYYEIRQLGPAEVSNRACFAGMILAWRLASGQGASP